MPVRAWRRYQGGYAVNQLQWREGDLVCLGAALVSAPIPARLAVLLGAAVDQVLTCFAQTFHGMRRPGAAAQQPLQASAVMRLDANTGGH
jgi:hypothetical protein